MVPVFISEHMKISCIFLFTKMLVNHSMIDSVNSLGCLWYRSACNSSVRL